jgi:branched-chain amino acid transport system substrate-binding protein
MILDTYEKNFLNKKIKGRSIMGTNKRFGLVSIFCLVMVVIMPFGVSYGESKSAQTLKIGYPVALTGFYSEADTQHAQGAKIFQDWINQRGGITIKGQKYNIEVVCEDIKGTNDGSVAAAQKLINVDGIKFMIVSGPPPFSIGVGVVAEPAKVLRVVTYNCYTPDEMSKKTPYAFVCPHNSLLGTPGALSYLKHAYPNVKRVAWAIPADGSPPYLSPITEKAIKDAGYKITKRVEWSWGTVDWTPIGTTLLGGKPDAVMFMNGGPMAVGGMMKALRELGFKGPLGAMCPDNIYALLGIVGPEATDIFIHSIKADAPEMTSVAKELIKIGLSSGLALPASPDWVWVATALWPLVQAIEAAQSFDPTVVKNVFEKMKVMQTPYGAGHLCGLKTFGIAHMITAPQPMTAIEKGTIKWIGWQPAPDLP